MMLSLMEGNLIVAPIVLWWFSKHHLLERLIDCFLCHRLSLNLLVSSLRGELTYEVPFLLVPLAPDSGEISFLDFCERHTL
jgi:hypothetical protein